MASHRVIKCLFLMLLTVSLFGCEHKVTLAPTISPSSFIAKKYPYKVAVVFSPEMQNLVVHAKPTNPIGPGFGHVYDYQVGNSLCQALLNSADTAYNQVLQADLDLKEGEFDKVIKFTLVNSNLNIEFVGLVLPTAKGSYSLSLLMEAFNGQNLNLLQKAPISGNGFVSQQADEFAAEKLFSTAVEQGIQQVSDNAANLLASGFGEIR